MSGIEQETGVNDDVEIEQDEQKGQEQQVEQPELEEISIAGAESPTATEGDQDSAVIRQVREAHREELRKRKELERRLADSEAKAKPVEDSAPVISARPKLEDFDYDGDQYAEALDKWHEQKSARAAFEAKQRASKDEQEKSHQKVLETYRANAAALPVDKAKFKFAEDEVTSTFDVMQQNVLLKSSMPERLVYAIGNNPATLERLAKIKDPIALAYEFGRTEKALTTTKQSKSAPPPDRPLNGSGSGGSAALDRLEAEAEKSGDRTKLVAYKKQLKAKAA